MKIGLRSALFVCLTACTPATTAAGIDAGDCVAKHALANESVSQIATACLIDIAVVASTLEARSADGGAVAGTPAAREARAMRAAQSYDAGR